MEITPSAPAAGAMLEPIAAARNSTDKIDFIVFIVFSSFPANRRPLSSQTRINWKNSAAENYFEIRLCGISQKKTGHQVMATAKMRAIGPGVFASAYLR
ncbi:MAG: hypothetical protein DME76_08095 [Verrucomicrobia bacterium]|nr:MAG: hypothetical protein DME76_08095 [Verrucomicrobiota bacterium]